LPWMNTIGSPFPASTYAMDAPSTFSLDFFFGLNRMSEE